MTPEEWLDRGSSFHQRGEQAMAAMCYRQIPPSSPVHVMALGNLAALAIQARQHEEAVLLLQQALQLQPDSPELLNNLGTALNGLARWDEAETILRRALILKPDHAKAHHNLGMVLQGRGRLDEAMECYGKALSIQPDHLKSLYNSGTILQACSQWQAAADCYHKAVTLKPDYTEALHNLGIISLIRQQWQEAVACFRKVLEIQPEHVDAMANLATVLAAQNGYTEAVDLCYRAIAKQPDHALAHANLGLILLKQGCLPESLAALRQAVSLEPGNMSFARRLMYALSMDPYTSLDEKFAEHLRLARACAPPPDQILPPPANLPVPDRPLRIGWLSSDLKQHVLGQLLLPFMQAMRQDGWQHYLYAHVLEPDKMTTRFQQLAVGYCAIEDMDDRSVAERIRADGIDILMCLAGRFDSNRHFVVAYGPAPLHVSMHDVASSGITAMDALITDPWLAPPHTREQFTERLVRLPIFYHHTTLNKAEPASPLPMGHNGFPTFGCFNNPAKINDRVLDLWARLLTRMPDARLLLKYQNRYNDPMLWERVATALARHNVGMERIVLAGEDPTYKEHLNAYHLVDIALDPFPFSGSTTTFDALWMGVPVITLAGEEMVSRWSGAMLHALGLDHWIATSEEHYITLAQQVVLQAPELARLRMELRDRVRNSPLVDTRRRAKQLGRALRTLWRCWCKTRQ